MQILRFNSLYYICSQVDDFGYYTLVTYRPIITNTSTECIYHTDLYLT